MANMPGITLEQQIAVGTKTLRRAAEAFRLNPSLEVTHLQVAEFLETAADSMETIDPKTV